MGTTKVSAQSFHTIVIGGGQAGLAIGYYLQKKKQNFVILDECDRIGDSWRKRWDSLLLFTPAQHDGLPGKPYPSSKGSYPGKDNMADYLENYSREFSLPVQSGVRVMHVSSLENRFLLHSDKGNYEAERLVVATGTNPYPYVPAFASEISKGIFQTHSSSYKNAEGIPPGDTLVVGAGTSGVEIALELSKTRKTYISGKPTFHIPDNVFKYGGEFYWWVISHLLTVKTPIGRKAKKKIIGGGAPLIRVSAEELEKAGIERIPKVAGTQDGLPLLEDGRVIKVSTIIWCTGYKPDFSWIEPDITGTNGWPLTQRGVSMKAKGLYFMGMPFQYGLTSGLVGGVGRDANYLAAHMA